jgi:hypothetical protein
MEVGGFEAIAIHQAEAADTGAGEVTDDGDAETAAAHDQDTAGAQFPLALGPDFL